MKHALLALLLVMVLWGFPLQAGVQSEQIKFTNLSENPTTQEGGATSAAWIDYDGDGDLDLYTAGSFLTLRKSLFRNDNGTLTSVTDNALVTDSFSPTGMSWADYDNDGDLDVFLAGTPSVLYSNDGAGNFVRMNNGDLSLNNSGWSPSWADVDLDGDVDLFITNPSGRNHFLLNSGAPNYELNKLTDIEPVLGRAPFTIGTWTDYDLDGDPDLFIGSGPANGGSARDYFYRNLFVEDGLVAFERIEDEAFSLDARDGQTPNWIDYDNDRDLDLFVTNWGGASGGFANDLYRNDEGVFTKVKMGVLVTDHEVSLSNVWGDFDNDTDLDLFVTNAARGTPSSTNSFYINNGDSTFSRLNISPFVEDQMANWGASAADYDNDGDLDLFVAALRGNERNSLYRNDLPGTNNWIKLQLEGTSSNKSGIGAIVKLLITIDGQEVWQMRQVSSQNGFLSHNSFEMHFGLAQAETVEMIVIEWPSGVINVLEQAPVNQTLVVIENS